MSVMRRLERRLESLLDGVVGSVFRGPLHPSELVGKIAREADLAEVETTHGKVVPNDFQVSINPDDLGGHAPPPELTRELERTVEELALERGWRMDGPARVRLYADSAAPRGNPRCSGVVHPGSRRPWAVLKGRVDIPVTVNRAVVGRGSDADVVIEGDHASRRHALLWQEDGRVLITDLGSANGTAVDGVAVGQRPVELSTPTRITFGSSSYLLEVR
jgi:hypothetical protein